VHPSKGANRRPRIRRENGLHAMRQGPGKHLQGRTLLGGAVTPDEFDYLHEMIICQELSRMQAKGYENGETSYRSELAIERLNQMNGFSDRVPGWDRYWVAANPQVREPQARQRGIGEGLRGKGGKCSRR
jgi:hypothetical protein